MLRALLFGLAALAAFILSGLLSTVIYAPADLPGWVGWTVLVFAYVFGLIIGPGLLVTALVVAWRHRHRGDQQPPSG